MGQRLGQIGEQIGHFGLTLEIAFGREYLGPALVAKHVAFGDAQPRLVRGEFLGAHELDRMRGDDRQCETPCEGHRAANIDFGLRRAGALQFDVEPARKQLRPILRKPFRVGGVALRERHADFARGRAGERNQPLRTRTLGARSARGTRPAARVCKPRALDLGAPAVLVLDPRAGQQLAQAQVAPVRLHEQQQPLPLVALLLVFDPDIAADDGLDAPSARRVVELDHPEDIGEISYRERRHTVLDRACHRVVDAHAVVRRCRQRPAPRR